jgi:DivIVA domain-containing protein
MSGGLIGLLFLIVGVAVIGGAAMLISGRWRDGLPEVPPDGARTAALSEGVPIGELTVAEIDDVRLEQAPRGYRMDEVDRLVDRLAQEIAARDDEIARLRGEARPDS